MTLDEYFQQDSRHALRQQEIAKLTQEMANAGSANSNNQNFVSLMNEHRDLCRKRADLVDALLR